MKHEPGCLAAALYVGIIGAIWLLALAVFVAFVIVLVAR